MKTKHLIPLAMATLCVPAAFAQSSVQIYGVVDVAVGRLAVQPPGAPAAPIVRTTAVQNGGVTTSYLGFRGTEDLGGGLRASFALEAFFRADSGSMGRYGPAPTQDALFSRAAWVGLQGGWGDLKLGNVPNPAWLSMIFTSAMGSNSLFSPSFRQQFNGSTRGNNPLDTSLVNTIAYSTPPIGGVVGTLAVQARESTPDGNNYVGNVVYRGGPMMLTAAFERVSHAPGGTVALDQNYYLVGGSYDFGRAKAFAQYAQLENELTGATDKMPHVGVTVPVGPGEVQLAWARDRNTRGAVSTTRTTTSLGYIHNLSKRTSVYGILSSDKLPVGTATSYVVGVRHAF